MWIWQCSLPSPPSSSTAAPSVISPPSSWRLQTTSFDSSLAGMSQHSGGDHLVTGCRRNNLELDALKTDGCRVQEKPISITLCNSPSQYSCFLDTMINTTSSGSWASTPSPRKPGQDKPPAADLSKTIIVHFYIAIIELLLISSITICYAAATARDKGRLRISFALPRRSLAAICYSSRTCTPPGGWGKQGTLDLTLPLWTQTFWDTSLSLEGLHPSEPKSSNRSQILQVSWLHFQSHRPTLTLQTKVYHPTQWVILMHIFFKKHCRYLYYVFLCVIEN